MRRISLGQWFTLLGGWVAPLLTATLTIANGPASKWTAALGWALIPVWAWTASNWRRYSARLARASIDERELANRIADELIRARRNES